LKRWFIKFERFITEGECLLIKNPNVGSNFSKYNLVGNGSKLSLSYKTTVTRCASFGGSNYGFSFTSFDRLVNNCVSPDKTVGMFKLHFAQILSSL
jgi:hypothetical protein